MQSDSDQTDRLPPLVLLFLNLLAGGVLALIVRGQVSLACLSPYASVSSLAVILLVIFHLVWRYIGPVIRGVGDPLEVSNVTLPIRVLHSMIDALHPWVISDLALWILAIILCVVAGILGLSRLSPFRISETPPIIHSFRVHYNADSTDIFAKGDLVEIPAYTQVRIEAVVSDEDKVSCTWSATWGSHIPAEGCATQYSPSLGQNRDTLSVLAQSLCKTQQAFAGLSVEVVQTRP